MLRIRKKKLDCVLNSKNVLFSFLSFLLIPGATSAGLEANAFLKSTFGGHTHALGGSQDTELCIAKDFLILWFFKEKGFIL